MLGGTKALSVSKITSSGMTLPLQKSPINKKGTWLGMVQQIWGSPVKISTNLSKSTKPGEIQSRFQEISQIADKPGASLPHHHLGH